MDDKTRDAHCGDWFEASGVSHIVRTLGLAIHPAKIGIALVGIILTFVLGGLLDWMWATTGGVDARTLDPPVVAQRLDQPLGSNDETIGVFEAWRRHERRCIDGLLGFALPRATPGSTAFPSRDLPPPPPLASLGGMVYGVWWTARHHPLFALLFGAGTLLIWSLCGGAICRIAAVQFAREEKIRAGAGLTYARNRWFDGFFLAPCIPIAFALVALLLMVLGGVVLRIPLLGDLLGGAAFPLALVGGFVLAVLVVGTLIGGILFWPAVAVEGSDAFDAFSRGISYALSRPWKTALYAILMTLFAGVCWIAANALTVLAVSITRGVVAFGTSPFGWWMRGSTDEPVSKLELLWPTDGGLHAWPDWSQLAWYECVSAFLIGVAVLVVVGVMWSFLASFFHSGATVVYFLLRRDVDGADLEDIFEEEAEDAPAAQSLPAPTPTVERIGEDAASRPEPTEPREPQGRQEAPGSPTSGTGESPDADATRDTAPDTAPDAAPDTTSGAAPDTPPDATPPGAR